MKQIAMLFREPKNTLRFNLRPNLKENLRPSVLRNGIRNRNQFTIRLCLHRREPIPTMDRFQLVIRLIRRISLLGGVLNNKDVQGQICVG
ncbi:MAG: hypothetical protein NPIRA03_11440 [Nitrospirales bacterium]|nr:MAG: hypothetical protein NPIRA03_11440 [Nitrospirales bacterium]